MIVMKFGGASLQDDFNFANVIKVVQENKEKNPIVVVSAMKGVTDLLLESIHFAVQRENLKLSNHLKKIKEKHINVIESLIKNEKKRTDVLKDLEKHLLDLGYLLNAVSVLKEYTKKSWDMILSYGEKLSSRILIDLMLSHNINAVQVLGEEVIVTDSNFNSAYPNFSLTKKKSNQILKPMIKKGFTPVIAGFTGATKDGETTTMGRGGSDLSASIIGACMDCEEVWFLKEVDGIMTHDPRVVSEASLIKEITYSEVAELSYFGAKVLHPIAIHPLKENGIIARIKNVYDVNSDGTKVSALITTNTNKLKPVKAISVINDICLLTIQGEGMIGIPGVAAKVFTCLADSMINVLMISQSSSEQNICIVINKVDRKSAINKLNEKFELEILKGLMGSIKVQESFSVLSLVGKEMAGTSGVCGKIFSILGQGDINIVMIAQGSSELNISFLIEKSKSKLAVNLLHKAFLLHE
ncbi:MAG: aspartate kinase [Candidatus Cloacimonadota bacterium]|nr:MAG: aspartate kinase [Candidatus Cloacimonadota bacterium]